MVSTLESDEAFARQLQAQELGNLHLNNNHNNNNNIRTSIGSINNSSRSQRSGEYTPLVNDGVPTDSGHGEAPADNSDNNNNNPTVINARLNEASNSRLTVTVIMFLNLPQILAIVIVLMQHWDDADVCDSAHTMRWKVWCILSGVRMAAYTAVITYIHKYREWLAENPAQHAKITSIRNTIDAFGLIWFIVGNMWLFADDDDSGGGCKHPNRSPIYNLAAAILIINYIQVCLPCIIAVLLIPVFCFCMPCLIRVIARIQGGAQRANVGASDSTIASIPVITIDASHIAAAAGGGDGSNGGDNACPICLTEMAVGDQARQLPCRHLFHTQCVDEWLHVNASCPTCRKRITPDGESDEGGATRPAAVTIGGQGQENNISNSSSATSVSSTSMAGGGIAAAPATSVGLEMSSGGRSYGYNSNSNNNININVNYDINSRRDDNGNRSSSSSSSTINHNNNHTTTTTNNNNNRTTHGENTSLLPTSSDVYNNV